MPRTNFSDTEMYAVEQLLRENMTHKEIADRLGWSMSLVARIVPAVRRKYPDRVVHVRGSFRGTLEQQEEKERLLHDLIGLLRQGFTSHQVQQQLAVDGKRLKQLMSTLRKRGNTQVRLAVRKPAMRRMNGSPTWEIIQNLNVGTHIAQRLRRAKWMVGTPLPADLARDVWLSQLGRQYGVRPAQIELWLSRGWDPDCGKPMLHDGAKVSKRLLRRLTVIRNQKRRQAKEARRKKREQKAQQPAEPKAKVEPVVEQRGPTGIEGEVLSLLSRAPMALSIVTISRRLQLDYDLTVEAVRNLCLLRHVRMAGRGVNGDTYQVMVPT